MKLAWSWLGGTLTGKSMTCDWLTVPLFAAIVPGAGAVGTAVALAPGVDVNASGAASASLAVE